MKRINDKENEKKNITLIMKCCTKCLKIVNIIYDTYFEIKFQFKKNNDNIKYIEYESLKGLLNQNENSDIIKSNKIYEELIGQILIILENKKYDINKKEDEFEENIKKFLDNSYLLLFSLLYTNKDIFKYIYDNDKYKNILNTLLNNVFNVSNNKTFIRIFMINFIKNTKDKIIPEFLSYLISLFLDMIIKKTKEGNIKFEAFHRALLSQFSFPYQTINNEFINIIIKLFECFYNLINHKFSEIKNNQSILQTIDYIIDGFMKSQKLYSSNELKKILYRKYNNEMSLFDLCIKKCIEKEVEKKNIKEEKLSNIEKLLNEDKKNKYFSYDTLKEKLDEINNNENNENNEKEKKKDEKSEKTVEKEIFLYCSLCLKNTCKNFLKKIIIDLYEMKVKEDKENKKLLGSNKDPKNTNLKKSKKKKIKKTLNYIGMRNLGNLCYLDSVIQQLFWIPLFKYSIMNVDDKKEPKQSEFLEDDNLLHQMQKLFINLSFTSFGEVIPSDFIFSIKDYDGNPINPNNMQDSNEFFTNLCDKIEESVINTKYKYLINNLFIGKICNVNTCTSCSHKSYRFEDFKAITIEVDQLNDINESLKNYISEENIEDYLCSNCNQKVNLKKATFIAKLPNILIVHLNRIKMNTETGGFEKIYSKFEFPEDLNLKKYCIEENNNNEQTTKIYKKKDEYYEYKLKGVNIHSGNVEGGHYISIIKIDNDKWYQFNDSRVSEFDIKNLGKECFGGKKEEDNNEDKKNSAYLLFYELSKKKPVKIVLDENEINGKNVNIVEYNKNNFEEIENEYDIARLEKGKDENIILNTIFKNTDDNSCYKYVNYDDINKNVNKEYFLEVFNENKTYDCIYGVNAFINFNNNLMKLIIEVIEKDSFNIKELDILESKERNNLIEIFSELIISYVSDDNSRIHPNEEYIQIINKIISNFFISLLHKEYQNAEKEEICENITEKLFSRKNIKLLLCGEIVKEIADNIYNLFLTLIKSNKKNKNQKLHESVNKVINEGDKISIYLYKILNEIIKNTDDEKEIDNITSESFLLLYYKLTKEKDENLNKVIDIMKYLINKKDILSVKKDLIKEIKSQLNDLIIKTLFNVSIELLILLIKPLQYNDENYSNDINSLEIHKLYTYCLKEKDDNIIRERQIKLIKFIFGIFEIKDEYTLKRIQLLLGYPTLVIKKDKEKNLSLFGVNIMNNDINTEIFEYISYNNIKKKRCVLGLLFPSKYENDVENKLDENSRNDLIYELINNCLGLNERKEGNYLLFRSLYLMQPTSIKYDNLYQEMKDILEKSSKNNNSNYDLSKIKEAEKECIKLIDFETNKMFYIIKAATENVLEEEGDNEKKNTETAPKLSNKFKNDMDYLSEENYKNLICDIIPEEIGKIEIKECGKTKNLTIFCLVYYTTYFSTKELKDLSNDKKTFTYDNLKRETNEDDENKDNDELMDFSILKEKNKEKEFFDFIDEQLENKKKTKIIIGNKKVLNEHKKMKKTLIRYYILCRSKKFIKINPVKGEIDKSQENNYYLPEQIYNSFEENQLKNVANIHRIKYDYNFLDAEDLGIKVKSSDIEKNIEYLE